LLAILNLAIDLGDHLTHTNLFDHGHSKSEVKKALNQHQKRDSGTLKGLDFVFGICLIYLVRNQPMWDAVAIVIVAFTGMSGMRYFVDQSVRNFYLHRLDWDDAGLDGSAPIG